MISVKLTTPLIYNNEQITELKVERTVTIGDLVGVHSADPMEGDLQFLANITDLPFSVVRKIDLKDWKAVKKTLLAPFLKTLNT